MVFTLIGVVGLSNRSLFSMSRMCAKFNGFQIFDLIIMLSLDVFIWN